ncbi:hypothetical protein DQ04_00071200 [Trypanosoma grayi]|uniref:hypothetical protein n=1 Tax=Trypanosoma grayi TaxID=71804 RepID=UPI0004F43C7C|nr:hypothetical protein DQ04_00071200 [Trypanosoma grayi]KEG15452.1 hypothetical protein DQ04_00071200 [Trypanosoma grayi]
MYGNSGPPKKYSTPRDVGENSQARRVCQKCASTEHWTFECKDADKAVRNTAARLSRTQMLRWGIKQRRREFVPEPSERETYSAQVKKVGKLLLAEAYEEVRQKRRLEQQPLVKVEKEEEEGTNRRSSSSSQREIKQEVKMEGKSEDSGRERVKKEEEADS